MLANRPQHHPRSVASSAIGSGRPISPTDYIWQSIWPYCVSTILGILIILLSVVIFCLEIALLSITGSILLTGVYASGVGIWCGILIFIAGIFILILNWVKPVRFWALTALFVTIGATIFAIINFSINASRVQLASAAGIFAFPNSRVASVGGLPAAELAIGIVLFLLCLAFIGLYIYIYNKISNRRFDKQQNIASSVQQA